MIVSDLNQQRDALNNKINETTKRTQEREELNEKLSSLEHQYDLLSVSTLQKPKHRKTCRIWRSRFSGSKKNSTICIRRETDAPQILD